MYGDAALGAVSWGAGRTHLLAQDNVAATQYRNEAGSTIRRTIAPGEISVRALFENTF